MNNSLRKLTAGLTALMVMATMTSVAAFADEPVNNLENGNETQGTAGSSTSDTTSGAGGTGGDAVEGELDPSADPEPPAPDFPTKPEVSGEMTAEEFLEAVANGGTVTLTDDITIEENGRWPISITKDVIIDGAGQYTITYAGRDSINGSVSLFTSKAGGHLTLQDVTINTTSAHAVQAYEGEVTLSGVTVNGGTWTAVTVNSGTANIEDGTALNPREDAYAAIDYAMTSSERDYPTVNIDSDVTSNGVGHFVWVDKATTGHMETKLKADGTLQSEATEDAIKNAINTKLSSEITGVTVTVSEDPEGNTIATAPEAPASGDSGDDSDSTSSSRDSGGSGESELTRQRREAVNRMWKATRDALLEAAAGGVVTAEADEADNVPTYVLLPLYGRDVTLVVNHEGDSYTLTDDSIGTISANQVYFTFEAVAEFDAGEEAAE